MSAPTKYTDLASLVAGLHLDPVKSIDLSLDEAVQLLQSGGRAVLLARLRSAGITAGYAGKVANALSKAIREGRIEGVEAPQPAPSATRVQHHHATAAQGSAQQQLIAAANAGEPAAAPPRARDAVPV